MGGDKGEISLTAKCLPHQSDIGILTDMNADNKYLGPIFISHSSIDKPFVRKVVVRLQNEGYDIWLDEHAMVPGDPLAEAISKALNETKVVIVIVSSASLKSKWLRFELNKATARMVDGKCRVIPVVKEKVSLPPEVEGLLYADFSVSFRFGIQKVLTALKHEVGRLPVSMGFAGQSHHILREVFGGTGITLTATEYKSKNYSTVSIPVPAYGRESTFVVYEIESAYGVPVKPLSEFWWAEFCETCDEYNEKFFLLITERPVNFVAEKIRGSSKKILIGRKTIGNSIRWAVVIVDLSETHDYESRRKQIKLARNVLIDLAKAGAAHRRK